MVKDEVAAAQRALMEETVTRLKASRRPGDVGQYTHAHGYKASKHAKYKTRAGSSTYSGMPEKEFEVIVGLEPLVWCLKAVSSIESRSEKDNASRRNCRSHPSRFEDTDAVLVLEAVSVLRRRAEAL